MKTRILTALFWCGIVAVSLQAQQELDIERAGKGTKPIPISISGFSGEVDQVLRFDLWVAGFEFVTERPQYTLTGRNNGNVEGRLVDALSQAQVLAKAYSGGSLRVQAHALANDIIEAVTGRKGVCLTKVAFKVDLGASSEIYVSDYDGFNAVPVTADKSLADMPTWVPGQRKLLYASLKNGQRQVLAHDLSTGARSIFARYPGGNYSPAVSPDGRRVALILTRSGSPDLWVCNIDGSGLKQLTKTPDDESSPCWSPDNSTICYVSRFGGRASLFEISADGGESRRISVTGALNLTEPDWSPDGKTIIFTRLAGAFDICSVSAQGGSAEVLAQGEDPSWAPNSRTVIFTRRQNNKRVLYLLDVPTKRVKALAQISGSCSQPSWSR